MAQIGVLLLLSCVQTVTLVEPPVDSGPGSDTADTGDTDDTATKVTDPCAEGVLASTVVTVEFSEVEPGCEWGTDGNLDAAPSIATARMEQLEALGLEATTVCDLALDFGTGEEEDEQNIRYDDHFLFTFNDVVLAASSAPLVAELPSEGIFRMYVWESLMGVEMDLHTDIDTYCLGEAQGLSSCDVPPAESYGELRLDLHPALVTQLAERGTDAARFDFGFITLGDDDWATDCSHSSFSFDVEVSYVAE